MFKHVVAGGDVTGWPAGILDVLMVLPVSLQRVLQSCEHQEVPQVVQVAKEIGAIFKEVSGKHFALQATSDVGLYQLCERVHYTKRGAFDYSATADELVLALTYLQSLSKEALFYLVEASTGAMAFDLKDVGVQAVDLGSNIENCCGTPKQACSPETPTECKKAEATSDLEGLEMRIAELELQLAVLKQERDCLVENQKSQPNQTCTLCASSVSAISERAFSHYEDLIRQRVAGIEDLLATKTRGLVGGTWKDEPSERWFQQTIWLQLFGKWLRITICSLKSLSLRSSVSVPCF